MVKKKVIESVTATDANSRRWKSLFSTARMAFEEGELRQASSLLARARELANQLPDKTFAIHSTEIGMAAILLAQKKPRDAAARLQREISKLEGDPDLHLKELLAVALRYQAQALEEMGDYNESEKLLKKSIEILEDIGVEAAVQLAYSICDLSALYIAQGRLSEAEKHMNIGLEILFNTLGPDSPEYVRADMIFVTARIPETDSRLDNALDGLGKMEMMFGKHHPNIGRAFDRYIKYLKEKGDTKRIESAMERIQLKTKAGKK